MGTLLSVYLLSSKLHLDTFKDIWELDNFDQSWIDNALFRYLQGYMGTVGGKFDGIYVTEFRYLQGYMGTWLWSLCMEIHSI